MFPWAANCEQKDHCVSIRLPVTTEPDKLSINLALKLQAAWSQ